MLPQNAMNDNACQLENSWKTTLAPATRWSRGEPGSPNCDKTWREW